MVALGIMNINFAKTQSLTKPIKEMRMRLKNNIPVSYTHLDVYKRQDLSFKILPQIILQAT